jgi:hypothetical protein
MCNRKKLIAIRHTHQYESIRLAGQGFKQTGVGSLGDAPQITSNVPKHSQNRTAMDEGSMLPGLGTLVRGQGHSTVILLKFRADAALLWWPQWKKYHGSGHTPWVSLHATKGEVPFHEFVAPDADGGCVTYNFRMFITTNNMSGTDITSGKQAPRHESNESIQFFKLCVYASSTVSAGNCFGHIVIVFAISFTFRHIFLNPGDGWPRDYVSGGSILLNGQECRKSSRPIRGVCLQCVDGNVCSPRTTCIFKTI